MLNLCEVFRKYQRLIAYGMMGSAGMIAIGLMVVIYLFPPDVWRNFWFWITMFGMSLQFIGGVIESNRLGFDLLEIKNHFSG